MKLIIGYFTIIQIGFLFIRDGSSCEIVDDCDCILTDNKEILTDNDWQNGIVLPEINDSTKPGTELLRYAVENIYFPTGIELNGVKGADYIEYDFEWNDYFTLALTDSFLNYATRETSTSFNITVSFFCINTDSEPKKISFIQPVKISEYPQFLNAPYNYTLPMPLVKGFYIDLHESIIVRNAGRNSKIMFNFDPDEEAARNFLLLESDDPNDKNNFHAHIAAINAVDMENATLTVYASESGPQGKTIKTSVSIIIDKKNSIPQFSQPIYSANLTSYAYRNYDKITLNFLQGDIALTRGHDWSELLELDGISEENIKHLSLTFSEDDTATGLVGSAELINVTEEFLHQKVLNTILKVTKGTSEVVTVLQILLPGLNDVTESKVEKPAEINQEPIIISASNGYMIATISLTIFISTTIFGYVVYTLFINKRQKAL